MSRRIFTKVFDGIVAVETAVPVLANALENWLAQEPIEVIGAQATVFGNLPSENDGMASVEIELSQVGVIGQDGAILSVSAQEWWNTAPAGVAVVNGHQAVTFPQGLAVPVKEEGYLYINAQSLGKTAGTSIFHYQVIVYYTKKGH